MTLLSYLIWNDKKKMKTRYKILSIITIIVILFLIFLNLPTIHKQPLCDEGYVSIAGDCILNYDLPSIIRGMIQERMDYQYFTNLTDESSDKQLQKILDNCNNPKGYGSHLHSYYNETHSINNHTCEWQPIWIIEDLSGNNDSEVLWEYTSDWNSLRLEYNDDDLYCGSADEELSVECYSLEEIVFGNARKSWTVYPGGVGYRLPEDSTLTRIYKDSGFGMPTLDLEAMLDDKIFVDRCESNGGTWNYSYHDCEGLWPGCRELGGIYVSDDITPPCTDTGIIDDDPLTIKVCGGAGVIRVSCVFEYEK